MALAAVAFASVAACAGPPAPPPLVVGTDGSPDSVVLANLYAAALSYYGTPTRVDELPDPLAALDSGKVSVVPALTGRLLNRLAPGSPARSDELVYRAMVGALPEGVAAGDYTSAADDKPAVAVTSATARAWGGRDLATLVDHCRELKPGAVRGSHPPGVLGTCGTANLREFPDTPKLLAALRSGEINAAWVTTATPDLPQDVVMLADRKPGLIQAQNGVPLYRRNELTAQQVVALNEVAGVVDTAALTAMRAQLADGADPWAMAQEWLAANPIGH